jgi:beta-1,3-galactosyltransferase 1/2/3/4/5/7/8
LWPLCEDYCILLRAFISVWFLTDISDIVTNVFLFFLHSATSNSILDKAIDSEEAQHHDFLRLVRMIRSIKLLVVTSNYCFLTIFTTFVYSILQDHVEGYHELSAKTKTFFSTAVSIWDADFYVKVDDDVHVNLGAYLFP